ncbi:hypothetical protein [Qiania dongpingensis]|uniref:ATPase involved in DNA repair n=1 Tax=Qiania dongpingensis TaxID=2763669 RepID=A0A7G9G193_9FIRM|nr:hypothetical protein [Qiania dongpingensis]QNM04575.1 hypothetical protein H9Q78_08815 [Qiania dongpingensis]
MAREIKDNVGFLQEAKAALAELEAEKAKSSRLQSEEKRLTRSLATEKKAVEEEIESTVTKRKEEITLSYDREISKTQDKLKKARGNRERAKDQGVKARIDNETAQLREENRQLKLQNATTFHQNRIPSFCNTKFYYSLYFTKGFSEILILLLTFVIGFLVLPCGIYWAVPGHQPWLLIVIYIVVIVVLCGTYIALNNRTKVNHLEIMKDARKNRDMIDANKRKIRVIVKAIEKDKNDSVYNLGKYDREISGIENELADIAKRKQEALGIFENETKQELEQEILENNREKLETMARQLQQVNAANKEMSSSVQQKTIEFTDEYGPYIGQEFMHQDKLDKLIDILNQGLASSITEAQQIYKNVK